MKKISLVALAALGSASAQAADLPARTYTKAPAKVMAAYDWTGFYLGANAGGSVGRSRTQEFDPGLATSNQLVHLSPAGAIAGVQAGYNWQTNFGALGPVVLGVEADIQASRQRDTACIGFCFASGLNTVVLDQRIGWFGTARARLGLVSGPVLSYVTGGFAYGNVHTNGTITGNPAPGVAFGLNETRGGWTLGSGVEASLGGNWTGKIEYLYVDLGTQSQIVSTTGNGAAGVFGNPVNVTSRVRDNIFRGGINYRFGGNSNYVAPVANWSGLYIGGNGGSLIARNRSTYTLGSTVLANQEQFNLVPDGYQGGVQIGYLWQAGAVVFGVEADIQGTTARDKDACTTLCVPGFGQALHYNQSLPYFGTARGRLGYTVGSTLFYATAGYAYGRTKTDIVQQVGFNTVASTVNHTKGGYAVGGGIESPLTLFGLFGPAWTVKSEYLFVDLGRTTDLLPNPLAISLDTFTTRTQDHVMRTGINYHFNTPVVAKY